MPTTARWKDALVRIANGESDPVGIAQEALRSHKPPPSTRPKPVPREERDRIQRDKMIKVFVDWWDQGRPPQRKYAKALGVSTSTLSNWLWLSKRIIKYDGSHRLHKEVKRYLFNEAGVEEH
jgi:hypothetical protein